MELREVMGRRRSIRFMNPHKPVEPEKIQMMFEASRIASHWGNVGSLRGIAIFRDSAPKEVVDELTCDGIRQTRFEDRPETEAQTRREAKCVSTQ